MRDHQPIRGPGSRLPSSAMRCDACEADNLGNAFFCTECGGSLASVCAACGAENPPVARFCGRCGAALSLREEESGEQRQLTVMFCDLVESTVLGEMLDPEHLHHVVRAYQQSCTDVVARHDGHVGQYAGDGLVVYFGYPVAHENDAERALHAGLDIVQAIAALNPALDASHGVRLALRIGIHAGPVLVAGTIGRDPRDKQLLGHTVNLAARLQAVAEPNSVVTTSDTLRLAREAFVTADLGAYQLKGIAEPVAIHRIVGRSERSPSTGKAGSAAA